MHIKETTIFVAALLAISNAQSDCPVNEFFNSCGSACAGDTRCVPSPTSSKPQACTLQCVPRCQCKQGYCRNDKNWCVPSTSSSKIAVTTCGKNEVLNRCGSGCGTRNETRCDGVPFPTDQICLAYCREVCECAKGYARNTADQCIPEAQCAGNKCNPKTEYLDTCGSSCAKKETNCTPPPQPNGTTEAQFCSDVCVERCECKYSYSRDNKSNTCVRICPS